MTMKNGAKFEDELTCHFKIHLRIGECLPEPFKVSKMFILMGYFWAKYILIELKKYRGIIFHETEKEYKIWRGTDLSFQNCHMKFYKFWPEHLYVSKIFILVGSFLAKYILFELKKVYRSYLSWNWRRIGNLLRNWLVISKLA